MTFLLHFNVFLYLWHLMTVNAIAVFYSNKLEIFVFSYGYPDK